jgi:hypothetical protein
MEKLFLLFSVCVISSVISAQPICNPNGNLMIYTNYDGGRLNINVDQNIPNLKIGIVSYESMTIVLSGTYINNVTAVRYAGYNSANNTNCGAPTIPTTTISGAPAGAEVAIVFAPPANHPNSFGNGNIICAYSCDTATYQGGCNTVDQIEAYFLTYFTGTSVFAHKVQYGCWTGTQNVSLGGTCCATPVGINNYIKSNDILIYPSPASDYIAVKAATDFIGSAFVITNLIGQNVLNGTLISENSTINIRELPSGIYLFRINDKFVQSFEVVK